MSGTVGSNSRVDSAIYAIALTWQRAAAEEFDGTWRQKQTDFDDVLRDHGFEARYGALYFGDVTVDAVKCVLAIQDATTRLNWFGPSVADVRMLRVEDDDDLMPAIDVMLDPQSVVAAARVY